MTQNKWAAEVIPCWELEESSQEKCTRLCAATPHEWSVTSVTDVAHVDDVINAC